MKRPTVKLTVRASFLAYLAAIVLLASPGAGFGAILALTVHELAHLLVGRCVGERFERVELTPFGGVMTGAQEFVPRVGWRGALVAIAGPLGNYCAMTALSTPAIYTLLGEGLARQIVLANAVMMIFNLLPALPLDGGRIVFSLCSGALGVSRTIRVLTDLGATLGAALVGISVLGFARWGIFNLSALIVGVYLIVCALRSRSAMLVTNLYAVVHERWARAEQLRHVQFYEVPADAKLIDLVDPMERCEAVVFLMRSEYDVYGLNEDTVCRALLETPLASVREIAEARGQKLSTCHEKHKCP